MKIIKKGTLPELKTPWWVGEHTCIHCHSIIELEAIDNLPVESFSHPTLDIVATKFHCPFCNSVCSIKK